LNRTTALSDSSSAQRGTKPQATIAKHIARKSGRYSVSNGQFMKTDRRRRGLLAPCKGIGVLCNSALNRITKLDQRRLGRGRRRLQFDATVPASPPRGWWQSGF
jgi:hypothetical protein